MSCPRSTARLGEVARPEGADDAEHVPGARGAEKRRSGARACDCDLRSTISLNKPSRLYILNKLEGLTKKKKY